MAERRHVLGATHHARDRFEERCGGDLDEATTDALLGAIARGAAVLQTRSPNSMRWLVTLPGVGRMSLVTDLASIKILTVCPAGPRPRRIQVPVGKPRENWRRDVAADLADTE